MLRFSLTLAGKDLLLLVTRGCGLIQALLLGLLLIFVFSISKNSGDVTSPNEAATIFWLSSVFCQILIYSRLYALEETNLARHGLLLAPVPVQGIWLGKALAALPLLLLAQAIFLPATFIFLGQQANGPLWHGICAIALVDAGICSLGSLLGAVSQGSSGRESLLSIIIFPLLVPLLLGGIALGGSALGSGANSSATDWLGLTCAFDAIFIGAALLLFGFLYQGDD